VNLRRYLTLNGSDRYQAERRTDGATIKGSGTAPDQFYPFTLHVVTPSDSEGVQSNIVLSLTEAELHDLRDRCTSALDFIKRSGDDEGEVQS